jgi:hypothetical protein
MMPWRTCRTSNRIIARHPRETTMLEDARARACANAATTPEARATLVDLCQRLIGEAVLGFRCGGYPDRLAPVTVSVYRSVDHDEDGIQCGNGSISAYDGAVYWYITPPEDVMRRA